MYFKKSAINNGEFGLILNDIWYEVQNQNPTCPNTLPYEVPRAATVNGKQDSDDQISFMKYMA